MVNTAQDTIIIVFNATSMARWLSSIGRLWYRRKFFADIIKRYRCKSVKKKSILHKRTEHPCGWI